MSYTAENMYVLNETSTPMEHGRVTVVIGHEKYISAAENVRLYWLIQDSENRKEKFYFI